MHAAMDPAVPCIPHEFTVVRTVCAWCQKTIRDPQDAQVTSHDICPPCKTKYLLEIQHNTQGVNP